VAGSADTAGGGLVGEGDEAFAAWVASRQRRLQRAAWLLTGDQSSAEDLVQEAMAKTWRHWRRVSSADDPDAYVRRVLVNTFVSGRRRRWRAEHPVERLPETATPAADSDTRIAVARALAKLPRRQRGVVVLRFFEDLSVAETALALGCPEGTVKSTTAKALAALRGDTTLGGLLEEVR
jgi:RNA polymerase sigma-70 factor (sigma-E family)